MLNVLKFSKNNTHSQPETNLRSWLLYQHSLTEKLQGISGVASLHFLRQQWEPANQWDREQLNIAKGVVIHREILMLDDLAPCWYARTIIPDNSYQHHQILFDRLKSEPLGSLIYNNDSIKREQLIYYAINNQSIEYHWLDESLHQNETVLWSRLSMFLIDGHHPFFLFEIFLPGLMRHL